MVYSAQNLNHDKYLKKVYRINRKFVLLVLQEWVGLLQVKMTGRALQKRARCVKTQDKLEK